MKIANEANRSALNYNKNIECLLKKILEPAFIHLGFNHFAYNRFMPGNQYMTLWADATGASQYFERDLDQFLLFENLIFLKNSKKIIIWALEKENHLLSFLKDSNYTHGISIYSRCEDYIEAWHLATSGDNAQIHTLYTNHFDLIEKLIISFQDKAKAIIDHGDKKRLAMYKNNRSFALLEPEKEIIYDQYLQSITPKRFHFNVSGDTITLTQSEFECLKGFSEGMTAKHVAQKKNISYRTVESHISNVKKKFNLFSKTRLIEEFKCSPYSKF